MERRTDGCLIFNARLLDPATGRDGRGEVRVEGGRITGIGDFLAPPHGRYELIDAKGLCLAPGLVDMRAQFGEPGSEHKERLESGCRAAAAGGVTSVALLPDTTPPIDDPAMLEFVARRGRQLRSVKIYPYAALTRGRAGKELAELGLLKAAGAVAFTDGERALADAQMMRRALTYATTFDGLVIQHPEDPALAAGGVMNEGPIAVRLGLAGIPACAEAMMIERDLRLVELTGGRYHAARVSTEAAIATIRSAKARGLRVTADTTPHHLALNELEVEGYRTYAKTRPPLRAEADRQAVVAGLVDGTIDVVASDHCPQDQDSKRLPFASAAWGVVGVETMLPVVLRLVHEGHMTLLDLLHRMTVAPADLLGLPAGRLSVGVPADLLLFDPEEPWKVTEAGLSSLAKNTAFEGRLVQGRVHRTLVDGRTVFRRDAG
ncbi:MAG: dihydroorotase [Geminicoccaceae bacterium]|nr:dihydroorotase [Geminicoccaceae bacterium]